MLYTVILLLIIGLVSIILYAYYLHSLRQKGWLLAQEEEQVEINESGIPGGQQKEWLFAGPPMNKAQGLHQMLSHYPPYLFCFIYLVFVRLPIFGYKCLICSLKHRKVCIKPTITDHQIYNIFIHSPLLFSANIEGDLLEITIPEMSLETKDGFNPSNLNLIFNSKNKTIEKAIWNNQNILGENGKITSLLVTALTFWAHPQTHIIAEYSAREIAKKRIAELEPSNRFVIALQHGLLYGPLSPINEDHFLSLNINRESSLQSLSEKKISRIIDPQKMKFRYYNFIMLARKSIDKHLKKHQIDVNSEFLLHNMVIHSIDHHLIYKTLNDISIWSLGGANSIQSYWRSQIFLSMWIHHVATPLEEEKIAKLSAKKYPFYHALYKDLAKVDLELANCILCSTSF